MNSERHIAPALTAHGHRIDFDVEAFVVTNALTASLGLGGPDDNKAQAGFYVVAPPLTSDPYGDHESREGLLVPMAFDCKASGAYGFSIGEISPTLRSMAHSNSHQNGGGHVAVQHAKSVRRLLPVECERLQGFLDNYTQIPWRKKSVDDVPDGPRYKAIGNSMAVDVIRWIGRRIEASKKGRLR